MTSTSEKASAEGDGASVQTETVNFKQGASPNSTLLGTRLHDRGKWRMTWKSLLVLAMLGRRVRARETIDDSKCMRRERNKKVALA